MRTPGEPSNRRASRHRKVQARRRRHWRTRIACQNTWLSGKMQMQGSGRPPADPDPVSGRWRNPAARRPSAAEVRGSNPRRSAVPLPAPAAARSRVRRKGAAAWCGHVRSAAATAERTKCTGCGGGTQLFRSSRPDRRARPRPTASRPAPDTPPPVRAPTGFRVAGRGLSHWKAFAMDRMLARAQPDHHLSGCGRTNRCCARPGWRQPWRRKRNRAREEAAWRRESAAALTGHRTGPTHERTAR